MKKLTNKTTGQVLTETNEPRAYLASHYNFTFVDMQQDGNEIEVTYIEDGEVKLETWVLC